MKIKILFPLMIAAALGVFPFYLPLLHSIEQAQTDHARQNYAAAAAAYEELLAFEPWRVELWERVGDQYSANQQWSQAAEAYSQALSAQSLSAAGYDQLANAHFELGETDAALEIWIELVRAGDAPDELYPRLYSLLLDRFELAACEEVLEAWTAHMPGNARAWYQLGLVQFFTAPQTAPDTLNLSARLDPSLSASVRSLLVADEQGTLQQDEAYRAVLLGRTLRAQNESLLAEASFARAVRLRPDYAEAWAFLGEAQDLNGRDGYAALQNALELDPDSILVQSMLASYWTRHDRAENALVYFQQIADQEPENPFWQIELGNAVANSGDLPGGLSYIQKAVSLSEGSLESYAALANYCAAYQLDLHITGLQAARRALLIDAKNPAALTAMGNVLTALNDFDSAERYYLRALDQAPDDLALRAQIAQLYLKKDQPANARYHLEFIQTHTSSHSAAYQHSAMILERLGP
ncbi:MAG: tetratricopeptide repeat protein [Anaerolineaceae bacterium]|nr:tetratricopeptide repeat protein [Anaerolineaceae bacterium]